MFNALVWRCLCGCQDRYVNGARVIVGDLIGDNGVVHIIDRLFYEPGKAEMAMSYIASIKQSTEEYQTK